MSKNQKVLVMDPAVHVPYDNIVPIIKSGSQVQRKTLPASTVNNVSVDFPDARPPNDKTFMSRKLKLRCDITVTFTGTNTNPGATRLFAEDGLWAFRNNPLNNSMQTIQAKFNGQTVTQSQNELIQPLSNYNENHRERNAAKSLSACSMADNYQKYSYGKDTLKNPLASLKDSSYDIGRSNIKLVEIVNHTTTQFQAKYQLAEYIMMSPFAWMECDDSAFIHLQDFSLKFTMVSNLAEAMLSHVDPSDLANVTITNASVSITGASLLQYFITPTLQQLAQIPREINYDYYDVNYYPTIITSAIPATSALGVNDAWTPPATSVIQSNNITVNYVPHRMYFFIRKLQANRLAYEPDVYPSIEALQLQFGNDPAIFVNASQQQLYEICRKNGYRYSFNEWSGWEYSVSGIRGLRGSIMAVDFGYDVQLKNGLAPGVGGNFNIQVQISVKNLSQSALAANQYAFYQVVVNQGVFKIGNGTALPELGTLNMSDVINAKMDPKIMNADLYRKVQMGYGGNIFSSIGKFALRNVLSGATLPFRAIGDLADVAKAVGSGKKKKKGGVYSGGVRVGGVRAGKRLSRRQLALM